MTAITRSGKSAKRPPIDRRRPEDREAPGYTRPRPTERATRAKRADRRVEQPADDRPFVGGLTAPDDRDSRRPRDDRRSPVRVVERPDRGTATPSEAAAAPSGRSGASRRRPIARRKPGRQLHRRRRYASKERLPSVWKSGRPRQRLLAVFIIVIAALGAVLVRVGYLQAGGNEELIAENATRRRVTTTQADRGIIFAYDGEPLAMSIPSTTIWANPKKIIDPDVVARQLSGVLSLTSSERSLLAKALGSDSTFVFVKRQLDPELGERIQAMKIDGIGWYTESKRIAPSGDVGRSIVGATDIDGGGTAGLELKFDEFLRPTAGRSEHELARKGHNIPGTEKVAQEPIPGDDLVLTLRRSLQLAAEESLVRHVKLQGAKGATAVITDVRTGDILALANVRVDPDSNEVFVSSKNLALDVFEPGSVAKVITMAAALNEGTVEPETYFRVPDKKEYWGHTITDAAAHKPDMTVRQIMEESSNNGTILVSLTMAAETQEKYMRLFGLGTKTALDLPGESAGIMHTAKQWKGADRVSVAYGYGAASTALQLAAAVNAVANGGIYIEPRLVDARIDEVGNRVQMPPSKTHEVIKPAAAKDLTSMMVGVVCDGTARKTVPIEGLTVAGKTGTAFKAVNGKYTDEQGRRHYRASFMGFFPAEAPQISMFVTFDEPTNHTSGSRVAGPVFNELAKTVVRELGIESPVPNGGCK